MAVHVEHTQLHNVPSASEPTVEGIGVGVRVQYLPHESEPGKNLFAYEVTIANVGDVAARLMRRHWDIIDAYDRCDVVDGEGVVGHQPMIEPGRAFVYVSFCPLPTDWGTMQGHYEFERPDGRQFNVEVAPFICMQESDVQ